MAQRVTTRETSLTLPRGGRLRLAVVADTHSAPHPATLGHLAAQSPTAILHGGDIGDLAVLDQLGAVAPVIAIRGNIDARAPDLPDVVILDVTGLGGLAMRILMIHIGVSGPRLRADVSRRARAARASLVVCGHSHVPFIGRDRDLTIFNPGSVGPRRFNLPIVFGSVEVTAEGVQLRHFSAETGLPWVPPSAVRPGLS